MTVFHVYFYIAIFSSLMLAIFLIMAFAGVDHGHDLSHHEGDQGESEFQLRSVRNLVVFFTIFGWTGTAMAFDKHSLWFTGAVSVLCGLFFMLMTAVLLFKVKKAAVGAQKDLKEGIGQTVMVYREIPKGGQGQIKVVIAGTKTEAPACNASAEDGLLPFGTMVKVLALDGEVFKVTTHY